MDDEEIDDEKLDYKIKRESTQKEDNSEKEEEERVEEEESHENENEDSLRSDTKKPSRWVQKNHPKNKITGDKELGVKTRRKLIDEEQAILSIIEPKTFKEACKIEDWVSAMNEELD